ncbi:MAG: hypothetical protein WBV23_07400 [Desulfobaccales bacterium]
MRKKELVAMFMESPLYFELRVRERLELLREHISRFSLQDPLGGIATLANAVPEDPTATSTRGAETNYARLIVGYFPPKQPVSP